MKIKEVHLSSEVTDYLAQMALGLATLEEVKGGQLCSVFPETRLSIKGSRSGPYSVWERTNKQPQKAYELARS
jgi:hypothetical protein